MRQSAYPIKSRAAVPGAVAQVLSGAACGAPPVRVGGEEAAALGASTPTLPCPGREQELHEGSHEGSWEKA
ncbi:hypothetical protein MANAM107_01320 [Actinomyces capricornis]|uniref:Uncharacterized protein n=1 Tax=Actinomyces capricornis TaxID=2755559 RepID=A0ABN6K1Q6_9ACTO|nr:hypothetical protein MANAM107_01320 [Actinomyces capricornis]